MRLKGQRSRPNTDVVSFPRPDGDIVFQLQAIVDDNDFDKFLPDPMPPIITFPGADGGIARPDFDDATYKAAIQTKGSLRVPWIVITTLATTPDLEWETVKPTDPTTWNNYREEFKDFGLSIHEVNVLVAKVFEVNSMNQQKLDEARASFLKSRSQPAKPL